MASPAHPSRQQGYLPVAKGLKASLQQQPLLGIHGPSLGTQEREGWGWEPRERQQGLVGVAWTIDRGSGSGGVPTQQCQVAAAAAAAPRSSAGAVSSGSSSPLPPGWKS